MATNPMTTARRSKPAKTLNLALQGGGAHGAFTWGVLDRLLEDERIAFEGVTGASAGAINAVVLASGLATGSREHARRALRPFWEEIGRAAWASPLRRSAMSKLTGDEPMLSSLGASSKLIAEPQFLQMLFEAGRAAGGSWLARHVDDLGERSSFLISEFFGEETHPLDGARIDRQAAYAVTPPALNAPEADRVARD